MLKRFCLFLSCYGCSLALGGNLNNPVTVVLEFDHPYSNLSLSEMEREAGVVLQKSGFSFAWRTSSSLQPDSEFEGLLVFRMKGRCSMEFRPELIDERGPLGMAFVSDGQVLSFGEVECDRVKHSVQRILPGARSEREERLYGRALGRVIAHEMYHMLSGKAKHSKTGITQASLTADELTSNRLELPEPLFPAPNPPK